MKRLNLATWRLAYLVTAIPASLISYWLFGVLLTVFPFDYIVALDEMTLDLGAFWLQAIPVVLGFLSVVINCLTSMGEAFDLDFEPPDPEVYPVPFLGLSKASFWLFATMLKFSGWMALFCILLVTIPLCLPACIFGLLCALFLLPFLATADAAYCLAVVVAKRSDRRQYEQNTERFVCPECGKTSRRPEYSVGGRTFPGLCPSAKGVLSVDMEAASAPCYGSKSSRKDLPQQCPECRWFVSTREGKPFVVSVAGAPSSGKTSFVLAVTGEILSSSGDGKASKAGNYHAEHDAELSDFRSGICRPTPSSFQKPHVVCIEAPRLVTGRNLYMFDVSGRFFSGTIDADLQPQYAFNDAVVFALDPTCRDPVGTATGAYVGFMERYRQMNRMDASGRISVPISVVVTHADRGGPASGEGAKDFLAREGYCNLVNLVEKDFSSVSFFSCVSNRENGSASAVLKHLCDRAGADVGEFLRSLVAQRPACSRTCASGRTVSACRLSRSRL